MAEIFEKGFGINLLEILYYCNVGINVTWWLRGTF